MFIHYGLLVRIILCILILIFMLPGIDDEGSFIRGLALNMKYQPIQSDIYSDTLYTEMMPGECKIATFIHFNEDLVPQWTSLHSACLSIKLEKLLFSDLVTTVFIPSDLSYWSESDNPSALYKVSANIVGSSKNFGNFITMGTSSYIDLFIYDSGDYSGTIYNANISLFDINIQTNIEITEQLEFEKYSTIFDHYQIYLIGSADLSNSWEYFTINLKGQFDTGMDSFQYQLNDYIYTYIEQEASYVKQRLSVAKDNIDNSNATMLLLEEKYKELQMELASVEEEYQTALLNQQNWYQEKLLAESKLNEAIDTYDVSEETKTEIDNLCQLEMCTKMCKSGLKATICSEPNLITVNGTCYKIVSEEKLVTVGETKLVERCIYINRCKRRWSLFWLPIPIPIIPIGLLIIAPLPIPFKRRTCNSVRVTVELYDTVFNEKWVTIATPKAYTCPVQQYHGIKKYTCWKEYDCATLIDEEPCATINSDCEEMKKQALIEATGVSAEALDALNELYQNYTEANLNVQYYKNKADIKKLERDLIEQEFNLTEESYNSALLAYNISLESYNNVLEELEGGIMLVNWLQNHSDPGDLIHVNSLDFSVSLTEATPTVVPISVHYELPYSGAKYDKEVVVDFNAPYTFVKDVIAVNILENAISVAVTPFQLRKRSIHKRQVSEVGIDTISLFEQRCLTLEQIEKYLSFLYQSLEAAQSESVVSSEQIKEYINTLETNNMNSLNQSHALSDFHLNNLIQRQEKYLNATKSSYARLHEVVEAIIIKQWHNILDDYHNETHTLLNDFKCYSFSDCVHVITDIIYGILADTPGEEASKLLSKLPDIQQDILAIAIYKFTNILEAQAKLVIFQDFVYDIMDIDYWCAVPPNITTHPPPQLFVPIGGELKLECVADSILPIRYRWRKNDIIIPDAKSTLLYIDAFAQSDAGVYVCEAINDAGVVESIPSVVDQYQVPVFNMTPSSIQTYAGDESGIEISCDVQSIPSPAWSWKYKNSLDDDEWEILSNESSNVLYFEKPQEPDEGWYSCIASTEFGSISSEPVYLAILPISLAQVSIAMEFRVMASDESMYDPESSSAGELLSIESQLEAALKLNTSLASITDLELVPWPDSDNIYIAKFDVLSRDMTIDNLSYLPLEEIVLLAPPVQEFELAKVTLETIAKESSNYTIFVDDQYEYTIIANSFLASPKRYICPVGKQLHSNYILCGKHHDNVT